MTLPLIRGAAETTSGKMIGLMSNSDISNRSSRSQVVIVGDCGLFVDGVLDRWTPVFIAPTVIVPGNNASALYLGVQARTSARTAS